MYSWNPFAIIQNAEKNTEGNENFNSIKKRTVRFHFTFKNYSRKFPENYSRDC